MVSRSLHGLVSLEGQHEIRRETLIHRFKTRCVFHEILRDVVETRWGKLLQNITLQLASKSFRRNFAAHGSGRLFDSFGVEQDQEELSWSAIRVDRRANQTTSAHPSKASGRHLRTKQCDFYGMLFNSLTLERKSRQMSRAVEKVRNHPLKGLSSKGRKLHRCLMDFWGSNPLWNFFNRASCWRSIY